MRAVLAAAICAPTLAARLSSADLLSLYGRSAPPTPRAFTPSAPAQTLRAAAAARGLFIGAAINAGCLANTSEPYNATFVREFSLATAENECKFAATEASAGDFTLGACSALEAAALGAGGVFRNHNLCWGSYNPAWLEKLDAAALRGALAAHIAAMGAAFGASSFAFDVVNEAVIDGDGAKTVFKNNTW
jgi:endo-1,4-beta-xylanase